MQVTTISQLPTIPMKVLLKVSLSDWSFVWLTVAVQVGGFLGQDFETCLAGHAAWVDVGRDMVTAVPTQREWALEVAVAAGLAAHFGLGHAVVNDTEGHQ
ncbi:hypothetical protein D3C81_1823000 [compost metagenome]